MKQLNSIVVLAFAALFAASCQSPSANNANQAKPAPSSSPANAVSNSSQPEKPANSSPANEAKSNANSSSAEVASTPTEAYKAAYAARKNKDLKALRRLMADEMLELLKIMGEGKPDAIEDALKQISETPQGSSDQSRNEKITGDKATLEYLDKDDKWRTLDLVKEDGGWKLTIAKPDPKDVKMTRFPEK